VKKLFPFIILFLLFFPTMIQPQWINQTLPGENNAILGIDFISSAHGVLGGWGGNPPQQIYGKAFYTYDGGANWISSELPDSTAIMNDVQMINENLCYGVGAYNSSLQKSYVNIKMNKVKQLTSLMEKVYSVDVASQDDSRGLFVESTDGGLTWHPKGNFSDSVYHIFRLSFIDDQTGFVVASSINDSSYAIIKTIDGGDNWYYTYPFQEGLSIEDIQFIDESNGIAVGEMINDTKTGVVLKTSDGGVNWEEHFINELSNISGVAYIDSIDIFIIGMNSNYMGFVYKSSDGGLVWQEIHSYDQFYLLDGIDLLPEQNYLMVFGVATQNVIPFVDVSFDEGNSWSLLPISQFQNYLPINSKMFDTQKWYLIGATFGLEGFVLFTNNSGGLLEEISSFDAEPFKFSLEQNYPNPFNPTTNIRYSISSNRFVNLKVYDVLGNEIASLVNEEKPAGTYKLNWDAGNLPSGVYFYRLKAGSFIKTSKMILLK
jgi:photosystem II stability/assembly factor-like uncharacterized protein